MPKPEPTNSIRKKARDIEVGDMVSYIDRWREVIADTPIYITGGQETVTFVLQEIGEPYARPVAIPADETMALRIDRPELTKLDTIRDLIREADYAPLHDLPQIIERISAEIG